MVDYSLQCSKIILNFVFRVLKTELKPLTGKLGDGTAGCPRLVQAREKPYRLYYCSGPKIVVFIVIKSHTKIE